MKKVSRFAMRALFIAPLLLLLCALAPPSASAAKWRVVGSFVVRDPALLDSAAALFLTGTTDTAETFLPRALLDATEGHPFAGSFLVSRPSGEVALVARFTSGAQPIEPETATIDDINLYRDGTLLAVSTGLIPDPGSLRPPDTSGTAGIELSFDVTAEAPDILATLRARDLTIHQRAAVEEAVAPGLALYPRMRFGTSSGPEGITATLRLEGPGAPTDHARHLARKATRKLASAVPAERLIAWYYDVDDHAERFRFPFLQAVGARGGATGPARDLERVTGSPAEQLINMLGNEALLTLHESPDQKLMPVLSVAFSPGDRSLVERVATGFPRLAAMFALDARHDGTGVWSVGLATLYPNPFASRIFLSHTAEACLLTTWAPTPFPRPIELADPGPSALLIAEAGVDLPLLSRAAAKIHGIDLSSLLPGAERVLAFLSSPAARGTVHFTVVSRPDAIELTLWQRKGSTP